MQSIVTCDDTIITHKDMDCKLLECRPGWNRPVAKIQSPFSMDKDSGVVSGASSSEGSTSWLISGMGPAVQAFILQISAF